MTRLSKIRSVPRWLLKSTAATAAVEFALVLPFLAAIAVTLPDLGSFAFGDINMESAVRASAQYAMNGGSDTSVAQSIGYNAWHSKPASGVLSASSACRCGSASGICGELCADGSQPQTYVTITASATLGGMVMSLPVSTTQVVRIQ